MANYKNKNIELPEDEEILLSEETAIIRRQLEEDADELAENTAETVPDVIQTQMEEAYELTEKARTTVSEVSKINMALRLTLTYFSAASTHVLNILNAIPWVTKAIGLAGTVFNFISLAVMPANDKNKTISALGSLASLILFAITIKFTAPLLTIGSILIDYLESYANLYTEIVKRVSMWQTIAGDQRTLKTLTPLLNEARLNVFLGGNDFRKLSILTRKIEAGRQKMASVDEPYYKAWEKALVATIALAGAICIAWSGFGLIALGATLLVGSALWSITDKYNCNPVKLAWRKWKKPVSIKQETNLLELKNVLDFKHKPTLTAQPKLLVNNITNQLQVLYKKDEKKPMNLPNRAVSLFNVSLFMNNPEPPTNEDKPTISPNRFNFFAKEAVTAFDNYQTQMATAIEPESDPLILSKKIAQLGQPYKY